MLLNSPFQEECLAFYSSASSKLPSHIAKSYITANEKGSFDARDYLDRHLSGRLIILSLDVDLRASIQDYFEDLETQYPLRTKPRINRKYCNQQSGPKNLPLSD